MAKNTCCPWATRIGTRKLIVTLEQWEEPQSDFCLKEWPNVRRMIAEAAITLLIGGGLAFAIRWAPATPNP